MESEVVAAATYPEIEYVQASTKGINYGLDLFLVKPPCLKDKELFEKWLVCALQITKPTRQVNYYTLR